MTVEEWWETIQGDWDMYALFAGFLHEAPWDELTEDWREGLTRIFELAKAK